MTEKELTLKVAKILCGHAYPEIAWKDVAAQDSWLREADKMIRMIRRYSHDYEQAHHPGGVGEYVRKPED